LTNEGISADLITAGQLDAGLIQIISGDGPTFRWDSYGISAYDAIWSEDSGIRTITGVNTRKFVRFDKYGIYGIDSVPDVEGSSWYPRTNQEIDAYATFALTWEGLKVTGDSGIVARIGKNDGSIVKIANGEENLFVVSNDGNLEMAGKITAKSGNIADFEIGKLDNVPCLYYSAYSEGSLSVLSDSLVLAPKGISWDGSIGGSSEPLKWKVIVGENFGITDTGIIYATGANLSGHIEAETGTLTNLDVNGKIKLIDKGSISFEGGTILYDASNCQWNDDGFFLYKGRVGAWLIVGGENGYLSSRYSYTVDGSSLNFRTRLTKSELIVDRFASSHENAKLEETYKTTWREIAEIVSNCSWDSINGVTVGKANRADRISCWWDYKGERDYLVAYPSGGIVYLDEAYLGYYDYVNPKYEALWADIVPVLASINQNSDARLKKEIEKFDARYNLFYDALQPKRYKYIDGTSDRYHTGFIAQEVVSALEAAGLTT
jgi:hypothetical protein